MKTCSTTISGPYTHENLTVFLIHGPDTVEGDPYLTLEEALDQKKVVVHETSNVGELMIENLLDDKDIFIQAGEIVRGGRQDRALGVDFVVPAKSGRIPVPSFCVEMGRWHRRGAESLAAFSTSKHYLTSKELKLAAKMRASQGAVWRHVAEEQYKLSQSLGESVHAAESASSFELTLEHDKVRKKRGEYTETLAPLPEDKPDVIGFAFAVNGQLSSAEIYGSSALFRKLWGKLLGAAAIEAAAELRAFAKKPASTIPTAEHVRQFLDTPASAPDRPRQVTDRVRLHIKQADDAVLFETVDLARANAPLHTNCISRT